MLHLILLAVGLEFRYGICFCHIPAHDRLVSLGKFTHLLLDAWEIVLRNDLPFGRHHVVEESVFNSRAEAELYARIELLQGFCQQVGRGVPEGVFAFFVFKLVELDRSVLCDRPVQLLCLTIDPARYNVTGESR